MRTTPNGHRYLWQSIAVSLAVFSIYYGIGYVYQGNRYATSPALDLLKQLPGHMHTHGVIMVVLGLLMIFEALNPETDSHRVVKLFCGYCIFVAVMIVGAWFVTSRYVIQAPAVWFLFFGISGAMIVLPPPPKIGQTDRDYFWDDESRDRA